MKLILTCEHGGNQIPEEYQKYLAEKDAKEICQELGVSTTNFWQIIHRAKLQLRACVNKNWQNN